MTDKAQSYKKLIERFGVDPVANRLLEKWLSDDEAAQKWRRLIDSLGVEKEKTDYVPRWKIILWLSSNGFNTREIAEELGMSVGTVKHHLRTARKEMQLGWSTRIQLIAEAIRRKIIP